MEAGAIVGEVAVELEEGASHSFLGEERHSRVKRLVGRSRSRSFLVVAFAVIVVGLAGGLGVFGLVLGEEVEVCCIVARGLAVGLDCDVVQRSRSSLRGELGCFSGDLELALTLKLKYLLN